MPRRFAPVAAALALALRAPAVFAQEAPPSAAVPDAPDASAARAALREGAVALDQGRPAQALAPLERAVRLGAGPVALFNLGLTYRALGRHIDAIETFDRYLAAPEPASPAASARVEAVREERASLAASLATLQLRVRPASARVTLDERVRAPTPAAGLAEERSFVARLDPGAHRLVLSAPGYAELARAFEAAPGAVLDWQLVLAVQPAPRAIRVAIPWWTWLGTAVAVAGAVTAVALAADGAATHAAWVSACTQGMARCRDDAPAVQAALDARSTGIVVSSVVGGVGLVVGAAGVTLGLTRRE